MKSILSIVCLFGVLVFSSCDKKEAEADAPVQNTIQEGIVNQPTVDHYICPKGCIGGGAAAAGSCAVCSSPLSHNQAFHAQQQPNGQPGQPQFTLPTPGSPQTPAPTTTTTAPSPAQNAAGVYHYTCPSGCAGGAGAGGACSSCGSNLAHNTAYHQ